jgi:hypothetical protein
VVNARNAVVGKLLRMRPTVAIVKRQRPIQPKALKNAADLAAQWLN